MELKDVATINKERQASLSISKCDKNLHQTYLYSEYVNIQTRYQNEFNLTSYVMTC